MLVSLCDNYMFVHYYSEELGVNIAVVVERQKHVFQASCDTPI